MRWMMLRGVLDNVARNIYQALDGGGPAVPGTGIC
jgi:hypothetical protein